MAEGRIQTAEKPVAAFVLSLLAGLWMLAAGGMMSGFGMGGMMGGWQAMHGWMWGRGVQNFGWWRRWLGACAGIVVLIGGVVLYVKPEQRRSWGGVILIVFVIDFFMGMG